MVDLKQEVQLLGSGMDDSSMHFLKYDPDHVGISEWISVPITMTPGTLTLGLVVVLFLLFYLYITRHFNYWKNKGVPYLKPLPLFGNVQNMIFMRMSIGQQFAYLHEKLRGHRFGGFFFGTRPCLLVRDPELIKHVLVKDFEHFTDWCYSPDSYGDPTVSNTLFFMKGERWRFFREKITPTYTPARIKSSFESICKCAKMMIDDVRQYIDSNGKFNMKEIAETYPIYVIVEHSFGIDRKVFEGTNFLELCKDLTRPYWRRILAAFAMFYFPGVLRTFKISCIEESMVKTHAEVTRSVLDARAASGINRKDAVDMVLKLEEEHKKSMNNGSKKGPVSEFDVDLSQPTLFGFLAGLLVAGYETTGNALAFSCYELATHKDVQESLRQEIDNYIKECKGQMTHEGVQNLPQLEKVLSEVMRMYPSVNFLARKCTKDYIIPGTNVTVEKGTHVYIALHGLHRDSDHYPDPDTFDPERFSEENKKNMQQNFTYMPFGAGPRMCIGRYLSMLELKIGLIYVLTYFELHACKETPRKVGLHPKGLFAVPDQPLLLKVIDRNDTIKPKAKVE